MSTFLHFVLRIPVFIPQSYSVTGNRLLLRHVQKTSIQWTLQEQSTYLRSSQPTSTSSSSQSYLCVSFPLNLQHDSTLRFIATYPPLVIYTADFTIIPSPLSPAPSPTRRSSLSSSTIPATVTRTVLSRIPATFSFPTPTAPTTQKQGNAGSGKSGGLRGKGPTGWDIEKMKFRIVFIVWPALVGLSMAI